MRFENAAGIGISTLGEIALAKETRRTGGISPELQLGHVSFLASEQSNHITGKLVHVTDDWQKLRNATLRPDALTLGASVNSSASACAPKAA